MLFKFWEMHFQMKNMSLLKQLAIYAWIHKLSLVYRVKGKLIANLKSKLNITPCPCVYTTVFNNIMLVVTKGEYSTTFCLYWISICAIRKKNGFCMKFAFTLIWECDRSRIFSLSSFWLWIRILIWHVILHCAVAFKKTANNSCYGDPRKMCLLWILCKVW